MIEKYITLIINQNYTNNEESFILGDEFRDGSRRKGSE